MYSPNKRRYTRGRYNKSYFTKLFHTHDLEENSNITVQKICSRDNLTDLFTNALSTATFEKLMHST